MSDPRAGGVMIPEKTVRSGFWIQVRDFERSFYFVTKMEDRQNSIDEQTQNKQQQNNQQAEQDNQNA